MKYNYLRIFVIILLIVSFLNLPIGYYTFLRFAVCLSSLVIAYNYYKSKNEVLFILFISIAIVFNPLKPLYFTKNSWVLIDIITIVVFFISMCALIKEKFQSLFRLLINPFKKLGYKITKFIGLTVKTITYPFKKFRKVIEPVFLTIDKLLEPFQYWSQSSYKNYGYIGWGCFFITPFFTILIIALYFVWVAIKSLLGLNQ